MDVLAVGNALVDILSPESAEFIGNHGLRKGTMQLVDQEQASHIYRALGPATERSGGSAANTAAGVALLGGSAGFIGRVAQDQLGSVFAHDIRAAGVTFQGKPVSDGSTGRSVIIVTPEADRTMCTFLGVAADLTTDDLIPSLIQDASVTYLEGYLWDKPDAKDAFREAAKISHAAGKQVALSLSDPFCVARHRKDFRNLVEHNVDILFANEMEICSLFEVNDFEEALKQIRDLCPISALTRAELGSVVVAGNEQHVVPAEPIPEVVDTTGAGDLYAAGFLYGHTQHLDLETCGRLGSVCAAAVITQLGARPDRSLLQRVSPLLNSE